MRAFVLRGWLGLEFAVARMEPRNIEKPDFS
jgi:hypothetical protein